MEFIDTHAHLFPDYFTEEEIPEILAAAGAVAVGTVINVGFNLEASRYVFKLCARYNNMYATIGLHPHEARDFSPELLDTFSGLLASSDKIVALGEIGLDYYYMHSSREKQLAVLEELLAFARQQRLPVVLHVRDAWDDIFPLIANSGISTERLVFHCFTGDLSTAKKIDALGASISLTGTITFPKSDPEPVIYFPLERIMLETDCPYLAPVPYRGKKNRPEYIPVIAGKLAALKQVPIETIGDITTANAKIFFSL